MPANSRWDLIRRLRVNNSWFCKRIDVLYYLPPCRRVIISLVSAEMFTACVNLRMDVCSALYFIWMSVVHYTSYGLLAK